MEPTLATFALGVVSWTLELVLAFGLVGLILWIFPPDVKLTVQVEKPQ